MGYHSDNVLIKDLTSAKVKGVELLVRGVVQGVGFRPFIFRLAGSYGYTGFAANIGNGVKIHLSRVDNHFEEFINDILHKAPPLARIDAVEQQEIITEDRENFLILDSLNSDKHSLSIPPDIAICSECLQELLTPADRRFLYPFINCTNCGPRFSIVEGLPYDRPLTSMRKFPMCPECQKEYEDPASRRFHAQPNSCWKCGPTLSWHQNNGLRIDTPDPVSATARALSSGRIVAIKGIGGFHLAADASSEEAVQKVRLIKGRPSKPLAVMLADIESVRKFCHISGEEEKLLSSFRCPIVLLRKKDETILAPGLAPGLAEIGVMLPYTPLHYLLFHHMETPEALVMTSANISGEPIIADNQEAIGKFSDLTDFFLLHDRQITQPLDDSVARVIAGKTKLIRRSRGYVPEPIKLDHNFPDILACGGDTKNTFCYLTKDKAYLSQHLGDLSNSPVFNRYLEIINLFKSLLAIEPEVIACDLHPDYLSSRKALSFALPRYEIQHHHAHAAAVMAEKGLTGECLAVIMDGAGLGPDKTIWGGEILSVDYSGFKRLAHLQLLPMPGGDLAAREIYRMGFAAWFNSGIKEVSKMPASIRKIPAKKQEIFTQMISQQINTPYTSSCGRLFDSVVSLLDLRNKSDYEGQSGMELEALAYRSLRKNSITVDDLNRNNLFTVSIDQKMQPAIIFSSLMIRELVNLLGEGYEVSRLALAFHVWLILSLSEVISRIVEDDAKPVILGGGCLQNTILLNGLEKSLAVRGIEVYSSEKIPANDGCIALGQAAITGKLFQCQSVSNH